MDLKRISQAFYIKLGEGGSWECICLQDGTIRVGFYEVSAALAQSRDTKAIRQIYLDQGTDAGTATRYATRRDMARWKQTPDEAYRFAVQSFFERTDFLRTLQHWILFYVQDSETRKSILRQHQRRAIDSVIPEARWNARP